MLLNSVTFPSEEAHAEYARTLRAACQLLFCLGAPPPALVSAAQVLRQEQHGTRRRVSKQSQI
eukprot:2214336-Rhodomonas_salina.3